MRAGQGYCLWSDTGAWGPGGRELGGKMDLKWREGSRAGWHPKCRLEPMRVSWSPWGWAETHVSFCYQGQQYFLQKLKPFITHLDQESGKLKWIGGESGSRWSSWRLGLCPCGPAESADMPQWVWATKKTADSLRTPQSYTGISPVAHPNPKHTREGILGMSFSLAKLTQGQHHVSSIR